jgi:prepilin-type N-terminal cleavage/methylation domain-containing protein
MKLKRGFTLLEVLVVLTIIAILMSVVLSSLSGARIRGRDAKRAADLKQLQQAIENYFENNSAYPSGTDLSILYPTYLASTPKDPSGNSYGYVSNSSPASYCIGTNFEGATPKTLPVSVTCSFNNGFNSSYKYVIQGP